MSNIAAMAANGMSLVDIAAEMGMTTQAVRHRATRGGIKVVAEYAQTLRHRAESMTPSKAVQYLLDALEIMAGALVSDEHHPVDDVVQLSPLPRRVMITLWERRCQVVTRDQIMSLTYFDRDEPAQKILDVFICKIRAKLPKGYTIVTVHGRGWMLK